MATWRRAVVASALCLALAGCAGGATAPEEESTPAAEKPHVVLNVTCPPLTMAYDEEHPDAEVYDLLQEAAAQFSEVYEDADVEFKLTKYQYVDEKKQVIDKFGTSEAADVIIGGSFNLPTYVREGRVAPLDDVIDDSLRADIDEAIWEQATYDGQTYAIPYYYLQNTLAVNADLMRAAGLERFLTEDGSIAQWSVDDFNEILAGLRATMTEPGSFPLAFYAANNQGDTHTMTLLQAFGSPLYDEDGFFNVSSPEGVEALEWISEMNDHEYIPKGAENIEFIEMVALFNGGQVALCPSNMVNVRAAEQEYGLDVALANFPNVAGNGIATSYLNGFSVLDNGDEAKVKAAKDFVRFIYSDETYLRYSLSGVPVVKSYVAEHADEVPYMEAYSNNAGNTVDIIHGTLNWEGVRAAFYPNIQDLLRGTKSPEEVAAGIDEGCNAAIQEGLDAIEKVER